MFRNILNLLVLIHVEIYSSKYIITHHNDHTACLQDNHILLATSLSHQIAHEADETSFSTTSFAHDHHWNVTPKVAQGNLMKLTYSRNLCIVDVPESHVNCKNFHQIVRS